jgi:hypothetical protein
LGTREIDNLETQATLGTREIDNLETQATLGTRHRTTTKNTTLHRKLKS